MTAHTDKSRADIAQEIKELADAMLDIAVDLDYYSGMDGEMLNKSRRMIEASALMVMWAKEIGGAQ